MRIRRSRRLAMRPRMLFRPVFMGLVAFAMLLAVSVAPEASSRPNPVVGGPTTSLQGVDCVSGSDCWAVGLVVDRAGARLNQAMHWNGRTWRLIATPDPGGKANADEQQLHTVSCVSASDCWAVGTYTNTSSMKRLNEALHWTGKRWKRVLTPNPGGTRGNRQHALFGVWCVSRSDCWAVGVVSVLGVRPGASGAPATGGPALNQVLHWNGRRWSSVAVHDPAGKTGPVSNGLEGVTCVKTSDCWAVGIYKNKAGTTLDQAQRFNGKKWKLVSTPSPGKPSGMGMPTESRQLPAVACPSDTACRAVGSYPNHAGLTLNEALRFNGKKWSVMSTPDQGGKTTLEIDQLSGIACTASSNCWAVGGFAGNSGGFSNQALRWDGKSWSLVRTPDPAGSRAHNQLEAVACASSKDCWAVGNQAPAMSTAASDELLHWNGRKWKTE